MRHCLSSPGLEWSISKSQWKPSQGCARDSGLATILALGLVRGDPQIYRAACLEKLWHLASVPYSQTTFCPRDGGLKGDPWPKNQLRARLADSFLHAFALPVKSCSGHLEPLSNRICVWSFSKSESLLAPPWGGKAGGQDSISRQARWSRDVSLSSSPGVPLPATLDEFKSHQSILATQAPEGGQDGAAITP